MKDYSQMSDEELLAEEKRLMSSSQPTYKTDTPRDPASMSDEELNAEYNRLTGMDSRGRKVLDEMHPAVSWKDRTLVKNFAGSGVEGLNYLKEKYPNLQWDIGDDGEPITKGKNEKDWRKLDPSSLEFSDITDIGGDLLQAVAETAGGIAGAAGGAAVGAPTVVGAIPAGIAGGMAGAGAAGASMSALKQGIGEYLGMNTLDAGQIAKEGLTSAAFAPLMGIGGGAKVAANIAKSGLKAEGKAVTKEAISEYLKKNSKGMEYLMEGAAPTALADTVKGTGNFLAGQTSGAGVKTYKDWFKYANDVVDPQSGEVVQKGLKSWNSEDLLNEVETVRDRISSAVKTKQDALSAQYDALLGDKSIGVDVTPIKQIFDDKIAWAKNPKNVPIKQERDALVQKLTSMRDNALITDEKQIMGLSPDATDLDVINTPVYATGSVPYSHSDAIVKNISNEMYPSIYNLTDSVEKKIAKQVNDIASEVKDAMSKQQADALGAATGDKNVAKRLSDEWKAMAKQRETINDVSDNGLYSQLKSMGIEGSTGGSLTKDKLKALADNLGVDITESVDKIRAYNFFAHPSSKPVSNVGTTAARAATGAALGGAYSVMNSGEPMGQNALIGSLLGPALLSPKITKSLGTAGHKMTGKWRSLKEAPAVRPAMNYVERASWNTIRNNENDNVR